MSVQAYKPDIEETDPRLGQFTPVELDRFLQDGYIIVRGLVCETMRQQMLDVTTDGLANQTEPVEFEADLQYPGSPSSRETSGGFTIRRLKQAHSRHPVFTEWICDTGLITRLQQLLGRPVVMPLAHHNCIMTKMPLFSSDTGWHQDIRYWSFAHPELISAWTALGKEFQENGALKLIPGTHRMHFDRERLDENLFLRPDLPENQALIDQQITAELQPGDVLFFHARTFHAATRNFTNAPKFSVVFTFRGIDNVPTPGTRSASLPEMLLPQLHPSDPA